MQKETQRDRCTEQQIDRQAEGDRDSSTETPENNKEKLQTMDNQTKIDRYKDRQTQTAPRQFLSNRENSQTHSDKSAHNHTIKIHNDTQTHDPSKAHGAVTSSDVNTQRQTLRIRI